MGKLVVNLDILRSLNLDFDRYFVLWYCATGVFEERQVGPDLYKVFNVDDFETLYPDTIRRDALAVLRALGYSQDVERLAGHCFRVSPKYAQTFSPDQFVTTSPKAPRKRGITEKLEAPKGPVKCPVVKTCKELDHFNSPEFITAVNTYVEVMNKKKKPRTPEIMKLRALELLRLSDNNEERATAIVWNSANGGWPGFFQLKENSRQAVQKKPTRNASDLYA